MHDDITPDPTPLLDSAVPMVALPSSDDIGAVEADRISIKDSGVEMVSGEEVVMRDSAAMAVDTGDMSLFQSAVAQADVDGDITAEQSGIGIATAVGDARLYDSSAGVLVAGGDVDLAGGSAGLVVSRGFTVRDGGTVLVTQREAIIVGLVAAVGLFALSMLTRALFRD
jgi:hypothetical protein